MKDIDDKIQDLKDRKKRAAYIKRHWKKKFIKLRKKGKSIRAFCEENSLEHTYMSRLLNEKRVPSAELFEEINKAFEKAGV